MRKQFNARIDAKIINLLNSDSVRFSRPSQEIVQKALELFYLKKRAEREPIILSIPPRRGGGVKCAKSKLVTNL